MFVFPPFFSDNPIVEDQLRWLTKSIEPKDLVFKKWQDTASHRLAQVTSPTSKYDSVEAYFNTFPALKESDGYKLLEEDFLYMYPDKGNHLYTNLTLYRDRIFSLARKELVKVRRRESDMFIQENLTKYLSHVDSDDFNLRESISLLLLPYIVEVPKAQTVNKIHFRPSRKNIIDSFILLVDEFENIENVVDARRKLLGSKCRTVQPFVAVVGPFNEPRNIYVVVNSTYYPMQRIVQAIDSLFKILFATWTNFPCESVDIWQTIQLGFYDIPAQQVNAECTHLMNQLGMKCRDKEAPTV